MNEMKTKVDRKRSRKIKTYKSKKENGKRKRQKVCNKKLFLNIIKNILILNPDNILVNDTIKIAKKADVTNFRGQRRSNISIPNVT